MSRRKPIPKTVGDLAPWEGNPRRITDEELRRLGYSMEELGDLSGVVFNRRTGRLVGGHQRVKHLPPEAEIVIEERHRQPNRTGTLARGYVEWRGERWTYREVDVDEDLEAAMNIAANKQGGRFDSALLKEALSTVARSEKNTDLTGFSPEEVKTLTGIGHLDVDEDFDPEPLKPERMYGVLVICRDAEAQAAAATLLRGEDLDARLVTFVPSGSGHLRTVESFRYVGSEGKGDV